MILYALTRGYLDDVAVEDIRRFEAEFLSWLDQNRPELLDSIRTTGDLPKDDEMVSAITEFKKTFAASA